MIVEPMVGSEPHELHKLLMELPSLTRPGSVLVCRRRKKVGYRC
jgi:hypothetical protein